MTPVSSDYYDDDDDFEDCPPAQKGDSKGGSRALFSLAVMSFWLCPWIVTKCLKGLRFTATQAWKEIPTFETSALESSKGIGDCLGHGHTSPEHPNGHPDGLQLHRGHDGEYRPVYESAARCWNRCTVEQRQALADDFGVTIDELKEKIRQLPRV